MVSEEKWKMVNSYVLEVSKLKLFWRMCIVEMIYKKYFQIIIMFVKKEIKVVQNLKGFIYYDIKVVLG